MRLVPSLLVLLLVGHVHGDKVFRSLVPLGNKNETLVGGARYKSNNRTVSNMVDITICVRFNFEILGKHESGHSLFTIADPFTTDSDWVTGRSFSLTELNARFPMAFFGFGYPRERGSYKSFFLYDVETNDWEIWATKRWIHVCLAYEKQRGFIKVIKVTLLQLPTVNRLISQGWQALERQPARRRADWSTDSGQRLGQGIHDSTIVQLHIT